MSKEAELNAEKAKLEREISNYVYKLKNMSQPLIEFARDLATNTENVKVDILPGSIIETSGASHRFSDIDTRQALELLGFIRKHRKRLAVIARELNP